MFNLPDVIAELETSHTVFFFQNEGIKDDLRVDILAETRPIVEEDKAKYERRISLLRNAIDTLIALVADGYPNPIRRTVSFATFSDLRLQIDQMLAALETYELEPEAVELRVKVNPIENQA